MTPTNSADGPRTLRAVTGSRGAIAHWITQHVNEDAAKGRPLPAGLADVVRELLNPISARGDKNGRPETIEVDSAEAARRTGYSTGHIRHLCRTGQLQARRNGRDWLITVRETDARADDGFSAHLR